MKNTVKVVAAVLSVFMFVACSQSESEQLKQARTIQEAMMKSKGTLDSLLTLRLNEYSAQVTALSQDPLLSTDSLKIKEYDSVKTDYSYLEQLSAELRAWSSDMKMLPSVEEIANGAENPFGGEMKDEDILKEIKESQTAFEDLKSRIETEIQ